MGSVAAFHKAKYYFVRSRYVVSAICVAVSIAAAFMAISGGNENTVLADQPTPNDPIGVARGVNPGRVVWVHEPNATDWDGSSMGDGHWWESGNTDMAAVDQMMSRAISALAGENDSAQAWDKIFRYFNQTHGKGDIGYQVGEKIVIKVNLVGCIGVYSQTNVDRDTYELTDKMDYMNTSPQMMLALLRQLVYEVGVNQAEIAIGDTLCYFPNQYYYVCHNEFPDVQYLDYEGKFGRTRVQQSSVPLYWSCHPSVSYQDYVPVSYAQADYIINMANFKSHISAGVTLCGKNHYGSLVRSPVQSGYFDLHQDLPSATSGMGHYRPLVDLMGHAHIGGKTLLYVIDGLYAGHHPYDDAPTRLNSRPFNWDWSSSLFVSQDPVAIDSVAFDFLWSEPGWSVDTHISGGDDYLHEAAQADNPPSGTFYDPDHSGDVARLASLGVHEHWNNATDKQYSRNLGTGDGIELISILVHGPNIKANGADGPITVSPGTPICITASLDPGYHVGKNAEWWVAAKTPRRWYFYVYGAGWQGEVRPCCQRPLFVLSPTKILDRSLSTGEYRFYFAVDGNPNGLPDAAWLDLVEVHVNE
jgi:hypothetical protein